jgi:hypothetical protein
MRVSLEETITRFNESNVSVPLPPQITNISYECKDQVRVSWLPQSQPVTFYRIFLDAVSTQPAYQTMNTTNEEVSITTRTTLLNSSLAVDQEARNRTKIFTPHFGTIKKSLRELDPLRECPEQA